ncbi:coronatine-insensitive protein 1-like, partial [Rutidosis leptorrhynchoides]|uniref:coronatine-insensitive protein 1-like n=1 Tax=Rutidosis leptorrhynchoides TaxID=125765 RepID=UPI003A9992E1
MEKSPKLNKANNSTKDMIWDLDTAIGCVMPYIRDPKDRDAASLVCKTWYELDSLTRKHVTIALCYTTTPQRLRQRFPNLKSLKLKGKPRAAMFNLIPEDWGGYVTPWINVISKSFKSLRSLHFRRMIVKDEDLKLLARTHGNVLKHLRLDKCSGFSTDGLLHVAQSCSHLKTFSLEESSVVESDGEWLHQLALNNTVLQSLNLYNTELANVSVEDLELLARN